MEVRKKIASGIRYFSSNQIIILHSFVNLQDEPFISNHKNVGHMKNQKVGVLSMSTRK